MYNQKSYNGYDTSLKIYINTGGDPSIAKALGVGRSTIYNWKKANFSSIIGRSSDLHSLNDYDLFKQFQEDHKAKLIYKHCLKIANCFHKIINKLPKAKSIYQQHKTYIIDAISEFNDHLGIEQTLKLFRVSIQQYSIWINDKICPISIENKCRKIYPNQLLQTEVSKIKELLLDTKYKFWSKVSVYYQALREGEVSCCLSTFYKYARLLCIDRKVPKHRRKNHTIGLRALRPGQIWHADVTIFRTIDNIKHYIYLVVDNYSRCILSWDVSTKLSSNIRMKTFKEAYHNYKHLKPEKFIDLVVDGGPENKKDVDTFLNDPEIFIRKKIAQKDIIFSNSMVEASNKMLKYQYLFRKDLQDGLDLKKHLEFAIHDHNYVKPYGPLKGLIPLEALIGIPFNYSIAKEQKHLATQERVKSNQNIQCNEPCL